MPQHTHSHTDGPEHEHEAATPGHSHDAAAAPTTTTAAVDVGPSAGGLSARIILTLVGAAAIIAGAFLEWFKYGADIEAQAAAAGVDVPSSGTQLNWSIFYSTTADPSDASFFTSAGFVAIVIGLLALLGLALSTGWLTRLAGALAIVAIVAYAITLYRADNDLSISDIGIGAWIVFVGGLVVLIAGFLGSRRVIAANVPAAPEG